MEKELTINGIKARQILDSRGNPTVEADVFLSSGHVGRAIVPSGASTGAGEALELRDGDPAFYNGKGVLKAVWNVNSKIRDVLVGNSAEQRTVDRLMIELDGTENKSNLGANAILAVSMATAKATAKANSMHFYEYVAKIAGTEDEMSLPMPMMNVMNGGAHADWSTDFQEYMIIPNGAENINDAIRMGAEVFHVLKKVLKDKDYPTTVGDEGGYAPRVREGDNEPLECIRQAILEAGYRPGDDISIAMDIASSEFYDSDHYVLKTNGDWKSSEDLINWYTWIIENYPVVSIEDGLSESDWGGWQNLTARLGDRLQLVGDDLFVTNTKLLERGIEEKAGFKTIMSHRSGESEDTSIAHLAVGLGTGQIKTGSLSRSERIAKYNELMRIAEGNSTLGLHNPFKEK